MAEGYDNCICHCMRLYWRELLKAITNQNICTDNGCFDELPTLSQPESLYSYYIVAVLLWVIIAVLMFLLRPRSLRSRKLLHDSSNRRNFPPRSGPQSSS